MNYSRILAVAALVTVTTVAGVACSGGSNTPPKPTPPTNPPQNQTVSDVIRSLEQTGATPVLDRSTSIMGPDADQDGVRDDIEAYIESLQDSPPQKLALRQTAYAISRAFISSQDPTNATLARDASREIDRAVVCAWAKYSGAPANEKVEKISSYMSNTRERFLAYDKFNQIVSGTSSRLPEGDTCDNR